MSNELFGTPKYGNTGGGIRTHKIEAGHNLFRFGPPYKSLAASGKWNQYQATHFGYFGLNRADPSKTQARPFMCPQEKDRRSGIIKVGCRECDKITATKNLLESRTASLKAEGKTDADIKTLTEVMDGWLQAHNVSKKYNTIAKNEKGEWGVLPLPFKVKQALELKIQQLQDQDGLSALAQQDGVWFDIVRTGERFQTTYDVQIVMESVVDSNGRRAKIVKTDTLTQKDIDDIVANCPDLTTYGTRLTQEQISMLANSNGDPEEVDNVFSMGTAERSKSRAAAPRAAAPAPAPVVATPAPAPVATAYAGVAATPAPAPVVNDQAVLIAQLQAQLAALVAASAPAPVVAQPAPTPAPGFTTVTPAAPAPAPAPVSLPAPAVNAKDLDDASFVAMFGKLGK